MKELDILKKKALIFYVVITLIIVFFILFFNYNSKEFENDVFFRILSTKDVIFNDEPLINVSLEYISPFFTICNISISVEEDNLSFFISKNINVSSGINISNIYIPRFEGRNNIFVNYNCTIPLVE